MNMLHPLVGQPAVALYTSPQAALLKALIVMGEAVDEPLNLRWWQDHCPEMFGWCENHRNPWRAFAHCVINRCGIFVPDQAWQEQLSTKQRRAILSLLYRLRDNCWCAGNQWWGYAAWVLSLSIEGDENGGPPW